MLNTTTLCFEKLVFSINQATLTGLQVSSAPSSGSSTKQDLARRI